MFSRLGTYSSFEHDFLLINFFLFLELQLIYLITYWKELAGLFAFQMSATKANGLRGNEQVIYCVVESVLMKVQLMSDIKVINMQNPTSGINYLVFHFKYYVTDVKSGSFLSPVGIMDVRQHKKTIFKALDNAAQLLSFLSNKTSRNKIEPNPFRSVLKLNEELDDSITIYGESYINNQYEIINQELDIEDRNINKSKQENTVCACMISFNSCFPLCFKVKNVFDEEKMVDLMADIKVCRALHNFQMLNEAMSSVFGLSQTEGALKTTLVFVFILIY